MKKYLSILLCLCLPCLLAAGCAQKGGDPATQEPARAAVPDFVDLTVLNSTMFYAEVSNIMEHLSDYEGKTIKVGGFYRATYFEPTRQHYHIIYAMDATACCPQDIMEFVWTGKHAYPDDYPQEGTPIELTGVFESYEELGETYYHLIVDDIIVSG